MKKAKSQYCKYLSLEMLTTSECSGAMRGDAQSCKLVTGNAIWIWTHHVLLLTSVLKIHLQEHNLTIDIGGNECQWDGRKRRLLPWNFGTLFLAACTESTKIMMNVGPPSLAEFHMTSLSEGKKKKNVLWWEEFEHFHISTFVKWSSPWQLRNLERMFQMLQDKIYCMSNFFIIKQHQQQQQLWQKKGPAENPPHHCFVIYSQTTL